jgi:uncharacterized protein GlcG (DUF336 family)
LRATGKEVQSFREEEGMRKFICILAGCTALVSSPSFGEEVTLIVKIPRLTLEAAQKIARAAVDACSKKGIQVAVTVVDRSGDPMAVLRDTMAPRLTLEASRQKAYTAVSFNAATSAMSNRFTQPFSIGKIEGLVFSGGGLPLEAAGNIVGAVGVAGAPTGEQDEACAKEGVDTIAFELGSAGM